METDGRRVVAIHQPNFFPWLGYFDKIARADVFVVLDHVQFPKSEGNWSNRVRMLVNGQAAWVTMPVVRAYEGFRRIDEMQIDNRAPWRRKLVQLLRANYGRTAAFGDAFPGVEALVEHPADLLVDFNLNAIAAMSGWLGVATAHVVRSSALGVEGRKTGLLVEIVKRAGGTAYLSGGGADGYQQDEEFAAAGIAVEYQRFEPRPYPQRGAGTFVPGLSALDALLNCGSAGAAQLIGGMRA